MQALNGALAFLLLDHILSAQLPQLPYLHLLSALIAGWLSASSYRFLARIKLPHILVITSYSIHYTKLYDSPTSTAMPASASRRSPRPATSGLGSSMATTTP